METDSQKMIAEIVQSNELLRTQIWILTAVLGTMFMILIYFVSSAWKEMKDVLENHGFRLVVVEKNQAVMENEIGNLQTQKG